MTTNNHPAHGPVSLDRLRQISEILSKAAAQSDGGNLGYAMADAVKVIDELLEVRKAEPVAWTEKCEITNMQATGLYLRGFPDNSQGRDIALYTAQPAPLVPETLPCPVHLEPRLKFGKGVRTQCVLDALRRRADYYAELEVMTPEQRAEHDAGIAEFKAMLGKTDAIESTFEAWFNSPEAGMRVVNYDIQRELQLKAWNACRAAMLQGSQPVSNRDALPLGYLQGHKDGLEWAAQLAEANHPQTGDWLYDDPIELAKSIRKGPDMPEGDGNSPVTPDGWIPVSERMPSDGDIVLAVDDGYFVCEAQHRSGNFYSTARGRDDFFETECRDVAHWMPLPAAPQQEVKS